MGSNPMSRHADAREALELTRVIVQAATRHGPRSAYALVVMRGVRDLLRCGSVGLWLEQGSRFERYLLDDVVGGEPKWSILEPVPADREPPATDDCGEGRSGSLDPICLEIAHGLQEDRGTVTEYEHLRWLGEVVSGRPVPRPQGVANVATAEPMGRIALLRIPVGESSFGLLILDRRKGAVFSAAEIDLLDPIAKVIGASLDLHGSRSAVHERVKELGCLYGIARLVARLDIDTPEVLNGVVALLPTAWQFPERAEACVVFDDVTFSSAGFSAALDTQSAVIERGGRRRGTVTIGYTVRAPVRDEGPFLVEERSLLDAVAREIGLIVERLEARAARDQLESQLRHADRLATIGQLAAGVAHELNEPLASILGYSELALKTRGLPEQVGQDLARVVAAALSARDVIRNLLTFARQAPAEQVGVDLNALTRDVVDFFSPRWRRRGVAISLELEEGSADVRADAAQMRQVLVNLLVNAVQAMPTGGALTVATRAGPRGVSLSVTDTGVGMSQAVLARIFDPFFTTKDVNEGTGLGLSVVHGIVTSRGGRVRVESEEGVGSRFDVELPGRGEPSKGTEEAPHG
jgi:two-component system, NtrC family, sensor kinase